MIALNCFNLGIQSNYVKKKGKIDRQKQINVSYL